MAFDLDLRTFAVLAIAGVVIWVLVRPQARVAANLGAQFAQVVVELRRPPRFRRRRWPQLVEQQVVLDNGRAYPAST